VSPAFEAEAFYATALTLVKRRHPGTLDRLGRPAFEHFVRVARTLAHLEPAASRAQLEAALLHDAFEPGGYTERELLAAGLQPRALAIIHLVTLPTDGRPYQAYIDGLCASGDLPAIQVKLADNLDAFETFTALGAPASLALLAQQYVPARRALEEALRPRR
jgi:(p)ppGpp synthase/HD superfamily hydrolase